MKKILSLLVVLSFVLTLAPAAAFAAGEDNPEVHTLQAGNDPSWDIGQVEVWNDDTNLHVEFVVDDRDGGDWQLLKTQVLATTELSKKQGSGAPGQFEYEHSSLADAKMDSFTIPLAELNVTANDADELLVAFHANVQDLENIVGYEEPDLAAFAAALPGSVSIRTKNYPNADFYFDVAVTGGSGSLQDGDYGVFCIDQTHGISINSDYTANVYSSYETLPESVIGGSNPGVDAEENLDLVNWVINNSDGYTSAQVQNVMWALIDDNRTRGNLNTTEQALYDAAFASGEGFTPGCGDFIAVILAPVNGQQVLIAQVTFAQVGITCDPIYNGETAWAITEGDGISFPKSKNWGLYYEYLVTE